jgi:hypothetical protein
MIHVRVGQEKNLRSAATNRQKDLRTFLPNEKKSLKFWYLEAILELY